MSSELHLAFTGSHYAFPGLKDYTLSINPIASAAKGLQDLYCKSDSSTREELEKGARSTDKVTIPGTSDSLLNLPIPEALLVFADPSARLSNSIPASFVHFSLQKVVS